MSDINNIEGFWCTNSGVYHYFVTDSADSLCGKSELALMGDAERQDRKPGREDCLKCVDIYRELFANRPPAPPEPAWTVVSEFGVHKLLYLGIEQSVSRISATPLKKLAEICNRNGTVPKKSKRPKCAADAPQPEKFLSAKANQSPPLPLDLSNTTNTEPTKTMSSKAKALTPPAVDSILPMVEQIPASQFRRYPSNRQIRPDQIAKMSDSIREVGVIQPITARQVDNVETGGIDLEIIIGECRWLGCSAIDPEYLVPCFVRIGMTDKEAARIHTIENFQRKDLDEVEEARAIAHLKETGWTVDEIMQFLGREKSFIYTRLRLLDLNEEAHQAIRDGNLTLKTAETIAMLPEEKRGDALQAVVHPTHSANALPQRQAIDLIEREFIEPEKKAKEWDKRKKAILENHPGAKWNSYDDARKLDRWDSGWEDTTDKPSRQILSDAANMDEIPVPTWGELAEKHGAPIQIGCGYNDEAAAYVETAPLIAAEKAAHDSTPGDCIFPHEAAIAFAREEAQRRKLEIEAHAQAVDAEKLRLAQLVLSDGITKTASKKLVETLFSEIIDGAYHDLEDFAPLFGVVEPEEGSGESFQEKIEAALLRYLRSKTMNPFEAMSRLQIASLMLSRNDRYQSQAFEVNAIKPADFPALHKNYLEWRKRMDEIEARAKKDDDKEAA